MSIKDFTNRMIEKQKESNRKVKDSFKKRNEKSNELREVKTKIKIEEIKKRSNERELKYKEKQEAYKLEREELRKDRKESIRTIKQSAISENKPKKTLRETEKERKRKEFERIMASNPQVSSKPRNIRNNKKSDDNVACCPKCGSTQLTANKKGFSVGKAVAGSAIVLPLGAVTGMIGKNKIYITCLNCGKQFEPGKK